MSSSWDIINFEGRYIPIIESHVLNVFINIYENTNKIIYKCDVWMNDLGVTSFNWVPMLVYDK